MTASAGLRYALRRLRGRPLFVLVAVSTLHELRPLPISDPLGAGPADPLADCHALLGSLLYGQADTRPYLSALLLL